MTLLNIRYNFILALLGFQHVYPLRLCALPISERLYCSFHVLQCLLPLLLPKHLPILGSITIRDRSRNRECDAAAQISTLFGLSARESFRVT